MAPAALSLMKGLNTPTVDVNDLSFQADPNFPPDKESTWKFPAEKDGWVLAHNSIRAEIDKMLRVLKHLGDRRLAQWESDALKAWWAGHADHIHGHHHNEDAIFNPFLRTRVAYPDKLEADHVTLVNLMDELGGIFAGGVTNAATELLPTWKKYRAMMFPHLHEEEAVGLPLARAYFTHQEVGAVIEKILKSASAIELGSFFHHLGGKKEVQAFMKQEGIPSFVWYVQFKGMRAVYREKMESKVEALLSGVAPSTKMIHKAQLTRAMEPFHYESLLSPPTSPTVAAAA